MYIGSPANTLKNASNENRYLLDLYRESSMFFIENINAYPSEENLLDVARYLTEITELEFSVEQAKNLLALYPHTRIKIACYDGIRDTDVRDGLSFAVAHFFLGCSWPTFGDKIDIDRFVELLQEQALQMGFKKNQCTE